MPAIILQHISEMLQKAEQLTSIMIVCMNNSGNWLEVSSIIGTVMNVSHSSIKNMFKQKLLHCASFIKIIFPCYLCKTLCNNLKCLVSCILLMVN